MALSRQTRIVIYLVSVISFVTLSFYAYQALFAPNLHTSAEAKKPALLYIPTGANFEQVMDSLTRHEMIGDKITFRALARALGLMDRVRPGAYEIPPGAPNLYVVRMLVNGRQAPVNVTFNNLRLPAELAARLARQLETDSATLAARLINTDTCRAYGFTPATITAMFIPDTYEFYWNISPVALWKRMRFYHTRFWTPERQAAAHRLGLTPVEATTLASIVEAETKKADEMPVVAGVYLNRLAQGMMLQADPTVVYAVGDFTIRRVREGHKAKDSPYNTYRVTGLPPGPIAMPSATAMKATLAPATHKYLFFVARADFSGYHTFAPDYPTHLANARRYQHALDSLNL
jgi:UPF0755 protein